MRILILSWEYPPLIEGGLARHVRKLSENLAEQGVDVHVLTRGHEESPPEEERRGGVVRRGRGPHHPRPPGAVRTQDEHMKAAKRAPRGQPGARVSVDRPH